MAVKTMPMSTGTGQYNAGWHEVTIRHATADVWKNPKGEERKYIDLLFDGYPDNMNLRIYEAKNSETGEEFKLVNLFRYAMAGIIDILNDPTGKKPILQYDDDVTNLVGTRINVFVYKNKDDYSDFFDTVAPIEQEGEHYSFTADQVTALKASAEKGFAKSSKSNHVTNNTVLQGIPVTHNALGEDVPF